MSAETSTINPEDHLLQSPYLGRTVLEAIAAQQHPSSHQPGPHQPPRTPPQPFQTHTRSGVGRVQIEDDVDQDYLYE